MLVLDASSELNAAFVFNLVLQLPGKILITLIGDDSQDIDIFIDNPDAVVPFRFSRGIPECPLLVLGEILVVDLVGAEGIRPVIRMAGRQGAKGFLEPEGEIFTSIVEHFHAAATLIERRG